MEKIQTPVIPAIGLSVPIHKGYIISDSSLFEKDGSSKTSALDDSREGFATLAIKTILRVLLLNS